jgi:hypothetical protein
MQSSLMKVPLSGGAPTTIASQADVRGLAVDATSVYWTDGTKGTVMRLTPK